MRELWQWWPAAALAAGLAVVVAAQWWSPDRARADELTVQGSGSEVSVRSLARREAVGESWEYDVVVQSQVDQTVPAFTVALDGFECGSPRGDSGIGWRETQRVNGLSARAAVTVSFTTALGCQWARAVADIDRELNDADRGDNALEVWFRRAPQSYEIGSFGLTRFGDASAWRAPMGGRQTGSGYFGEFWFTSGSTSRTQPVNFAVWSISVPPGPYRLFAHIPRHGDLNSQRKPDAAAAVYQVYDQTGRWRDMVTIDQERFGDMWVPLGTYHLNWQSRVRLGDNVGATTNGGVWVLFDTVRALAEPTLFMATNPGP